MASSGTVIFNARALSVSRVIDGFLDVFLDVSLDVSFVGLFFGRNTYSTGYTTFALLAVTGARQARI
jgi:hypothetical protein